MKAMKQIWLIIMVLISTLSCSDEKTEPSKMAMEVRDYVEQTLYDFGKEQGVYLWSSKLWADNMQTRVEYVLAPDLLEEYNVANNKSLKMLPTDCFHAEKTAYEIGDEQKVARFKVMCNPSKIAALSRYETLEYALAYRLKVNGQFVNEKYGSVIVGLKVVKPMIYTNTEEVKEVLVNGERDFSLDITCMSNYDNRLYVPLKFAVAPEYVSVLSQKENSNYKAVPEEAVSWQNTDVTLDRKEKSKKVNFIVDATKLPKGTSVLPIKVDVNFEGVTSNPMSNVKYYKFLNNVINHSEWNVTTCRTWRGTAAQISDGNPTGSWIAAGESLRDPDGFFVTLSLKDAGKVVEFQSLDLWTAFYANSYRGQDICDFYVSMDGVNWTKVGTHKFQLNNGIVYQGRQSVTLTKTTGRYLKVLCTKWYDTAFGFQEISVRGELKNKE